MDRNRLRMLAALGVIRMSQPPEGAPGGGADPRPPVPTPPPSGAPAPPADPKTFDQEFVTAIATREHDRGNRDGKRQADTDWLSRLGVSTVEEAEALAALAKTAREADDKNKTEAQRNLEAAAKTKAEAETLKAEAQAERFASRLERALTRAGMDEKVQPNVTVPGLTVESTPEEIETAITKLKTDVPNLFGAVTPPPPTADPLKPPGFRPPTGDFGGEGAKRFQAQAEREANRAKVAGGNR